MRTTLTLDDDIAAKLKSETRRAGKPFRDVVNETLRRGLASRRAAASTEPFKVVARDLGNSSPGMYLDDVARLIEQVEGSAAR
ncbi:MAG: hypothetical protein K5872_07715 [Rhizobiaceae bacterium]|nr:hypothetical protein [Rhizobiaceae bacterium]MCV0406101.1 hypothetical protein [Rhizobiaceae bacterium]